MPRRKDLAPDEWHRRVTALNEMFAELREAVERHREYLWSEGSKAASERLTDQGLVTPDPEEAARWYARAVDLENQWLEALACKGHQMGLPNMYGRDGRPRAVPRTAWGPVPEKDVARVYRDLKAAWAAGDFERLRICLLASHHIPAEVLDNMPAADRVAHEAKVEGEAAKYVETKGSQSAFTWRRLEGDYARRLGIGVSTLQRLGGAGRAMSKR